MRKPPPVFLSPLYDARMTQLTRREFLLISGTIAAGTLAAGPAAALSPAQGVSGVYGPQVIYRLWLRGRRGGKGAKLWNANLRFATMVAADQNRAHPGDNSRIVPIVVSADEYDRLFTSRSSDVADLRAVGGPVLVGDCDRNGRVVINELGRGENIALGHAQVSECTPFDRVANGRVTVDELVRGVRNALE